MRWIIKKLSAIFSRKNNRFDIIYDVEVELDEATLKILRCHDGILYYLQYKETNKKPENIIHLDDFLGK